MSSTEFISLRVLYVYSLITLWKDPQGFFCLILASFLLSKLRDPPAVSQNRARFLSMQAQAPLLSSFNLAVHQIPASINQLNGNTGTGETQSLDQK